MATIEDHLKKLEADDDSKCYALAQILREMCLQSGLEIHREIEKECDR